MKKAAVCILFLLLCCSACCAPAPAAAPEAGAGAAHTEALHLARAQLGRLAERVSEREEERVVALLERIIPLRQARQASGGWQPEGEEARLVAQLNRLYERYTARYLGDGGGWDSDSPADRVLAEYWIQEDETLRPDPESTFRPGRRSGGGIRGALGANARPSAGGKLGGVFPLHRLYRRGGRDPGLCGGAGRRGGALGDRGGPCGRGRRGLVYRDGAPRVYPLPDPQRRSGDLYRGSDRRHLQ